MSEVSLQGEVRPPAVGVWVSALNAFTVAPGYDVHDQGLSIVCV